ncbi:peptide ABC transporter ATP-binding protein [Clostridia bacterium]|nr:peptide ABC transporter ATP-binding protein [Clostridia bacterium]
MTDECLVRVEDVRRHYPVSKGLFGKTDYVRAVDGVSLEVRRGEVFGIVGESGCGKSTLGRMMCKLEPITSGRITLAGQDISQLKPSQSTSIRKTVQMIFQDPYASLNPRMTVGEIVGEPLIVHHLADSAPDRAQKVLKLLEDVGLAGYHLKRYAHEFSGGQRQRIGIARALAVRPEIIIADEPVSALDVSIQSQVLNLLNQIKLEYSLTFVFIAHNLNVVEFFSDRIGVMYLGDMVEIASKDALYRNPLHPYTQALMEAIPVMHPNNRRSRMILEGNIPSALNPPSGCKFHTRCPKCMPRCKEQAPREVRVSDEQVIYCHLYD